MDLLVWGELTLFVVLLGFSAFFSSSETALFSISNVQLEQLRRDGHPRITLIERMLSEPRRLIITILIGNELVNVAASVISAVVIIKLFGADKKFINLLVMVPVLLLVGEITPKTFAVRHNIAFANVQCGPIEAFARMITPLRWLVRLVSEWFITLIVGRERSQPPTESFRSRRSTKRRAASSLPTEHAETLGGLLLHHCGELPPEGAELSVGGLSFTIDEVMDNRVKTVIWRREWCRPCAYVCARAR